MQSKQPPPPLYNLVQISDAKQVAATSLQPGTNSLLQPTATARHQEFSFFVTNATDETPSQYKLQ